MATIARGLGGVLGAFGGGPAEVTLGAATAKFAQTVAQTRDKLLTATKKLGAQTSPVLGNDFYKALALGGAQPAEEARAKESEKLLGVKIDPRKVPAIGLGAILLLGVIWMVFRRG